MDYKSKCPYCSFVNWKLIGWLKPYEKITCMKCYKKYTFFK